MEIGVKMPLGFSGEYDGWEPKRAWDRTVAVAHQAEALGFESIWVFDHLQTMLESAEQPAFESFTSLAALAALTDRVRLGHIVLCAGFRNPAYTAKMISTLDVISGGRMELGIGAGWKEDEWRAYGYGFPPTGVRLAMLRDHLEVIIRMLGPGRATYQGTYASVDGAINVPRGVQRPRVPIMVGGNGPNVTWRLAARYADELNVDGFSPSEVAEALPVIRARCLEIGRDPASLRVSVSIWADRIEPEGPSRVRLLAAYRALGVTRVMALPPRSVETDAALESFAEDALAAGAHLHGWRGLSGAQ